MEVGERYATTWHGLFPRFFLAGLVIAFLGVLLQLTISAVLPITGRTTSSELLFRSEVRDVVFVLFSPFGVFVLFYLSSRIRINLGNDYVAIAASIFLGALVALLLFSLPEALLSGQYGFGGSAVDGLLQSTAGAISSSISFTLTGFVAVLVSYRRRI